MTQLDAALDYATRGWRVVPLHAPRSDDTCSCERDDCASPAKHPRTTHGLHDSTLDKAKIRAWWKRWPQANVGIVTGVSSCLVVLDVDPAHGGEASLDRLEDRHGELPTTARAFTGGEGFHYLFAHPGGTIRNNAGTKLGDGLDIRGDGGYIVAPPSRHITGNEYKWLALGADIPAMPDWLLERLRDPEPPARPAAPAALRRDQNGSSRYALEALEREAADVARAPEGTRNHTPESGRVQPRPARRRRRARGAPGDRHAHQRRSASV